MNYKNTCMCVTPYARSTNIPYELVHGIDVYNNLIHPIFRNIPYDERTLSSDASKHVNDMVGGVTPLLYALRSLSDKETRESRLNNASGWTRQLLSLGANVNDQDYPQGNTPLIYAIMYGNLALVNLLLDHGADVNKTDKNGTTPLMYAIQYGDLAMVDLLLDRGADVNKPNKYGTTPLMYAIQYGDLAMVDLLLYYGAAKTVDTAELNCAVRYGTESMVDRLLEAGAKPSPKTVMLAIEENSIDKLRILLRNGATIPERDTTRFRLTPLMWAVINNNIEMVELLLNAGVDITATCEGKTPLDRAKEKKFHDIVDLLERWESFR